MFCWLTVVYDKLPKQDICKGSGPGSQRNMIRDADEYDRGIVMQPAGARWERWAAMHQCGGNTHESGASRGRSHTGRCAERPSCPMKGKALQVGVWRGEEGVVKRTVEKPMVGSQQVHDRTTRYPKCSVVLSNNGGHGTLGP